MAVVLTTDPAVRCGACALRTQRQFRRLDSSELAARQALKRGHRIVPAGTLIVHHGERSRFVYTLYSGWALRYRESPRCMRQILEVMLPGDIIGLPSAFDNASCMVQALTSVSLCVLDAELLLGSIESNGRFALDLFRARMDDERRTDGRLVMLGQMNGEERVGYLLIETYYRLHQRAMADGGACAFPLRRSDIADAVGLSRVHVMRALRKLRSLGLVRLDGTDLFIADLKKLAAHVGFDPSQGRGRGCSSEPARVTMFVACR